MTTPNEPASATKPASATTGSAAYTHAQILEAIVPVIDPEIGLSIVDLGLIYKTQMLEDGKTAHVLMTLTSPMCPMGPQIMSEVHVAVLKLEGVEEVKVELTFNPAWDPKTMANDEVQMMLGMF